VSVKRAKGKGKATAKRVAEGKGPLKASKQVDMAQVRENINNLVMNSARKIAIEVIKVALTGQLATAKYLFEAVGLYPADELSEARPQETTIAHQLLRRMGIPLEPVVQDEDGEMLIKEAKPVGMPAEVEEEKPAEKNREENGLPEGEA
jgi:hypothetical protein